MNGKMPAVATASVVAILASRSIPHEVVAGLAVASEGKPESALLGTTFGSTKSIEGLTGGYSTSLYYKASTMFSSPARAEYRWWFSSNHYDYEKDRRSLRVIEYPFQREVGIALFGKDSAHLDEVKIPYDEDRAKTSAAVLDACAEMVRKHAPRTIPYVAGHGRAPISNPGSRFISNPKDR